MAALPNVANAAMQHNEKRFEMLVTVRLKLNRQLVD